MAVFLLREAKVTHWNGLDKSGGQVNALDSAEYSGSLIMLLNEGIGFVKRNMKMRLTMRWEWSQNFIQTE